MSIKLKAVYKLIPPAWYNSEITEENIEDLALFTGDMLDISMHKDERRRKLRKKGLKPHREIEE